MNLFKRIYSKTKNSISSEVASIHIDEASNVSLFELLRNKWTNLDEMQKKRCKNRISLLALFGFFLVVLLAVLHHRDEQLLHIMMQNEKKRSGAITDAITGIRTQVDKLSDRDTAQVKPALNKINNELDDVEKNVTGVAKSAEVQKIAADMEAHLNNLEKTVSSGSNAKLYLEPKALPFQVISIDVISQQPFVSVDYDHRITPLGVGDSLGGWKVISADYAAVEVEFQNNKGQYVKINALGNI